MGETDKRIEESKYKFRWSLLRRKSGQEKGMGSNGEGPAESSNLSSFPASQEWCTFGMVEEFTILRCPQLLLPVPLNLTGH